jgi:hypothetical protein
LAADGVIGSSARIATAMASAASMYRCAADRYRADWSRKPALNVSSHGSNGPRLVRRFMAFPSWQPMG